MTQPRIPERVEVQIVALREHIHELNDRAKKRGSLGGFVTKPTILSDAELAFRTIQDDDVLDEFLGDVLGGLYGQVELDELPPGYGPLVTVLEFERHCQFEGWTAVSNKGAEETVSIIESYRVVGLSDEAAALSKVLEAYVALADDEDEAFHDKLGAAYRSMRNSTPEIEDRIPVILAYVRNNPSLFAG